MIYFQLSIFHIVMTKQWKRQIRINYFSVSLLHNTLICWQFSIVHFHSYFWTFLMNVYACIRWIFSIILGPFHTHHAQEIWKRESFHSGSASNLFRPHYAGKIYKHNSHRTFWIWVWGKLGRGKHVIIARPELITRSEPATTIIN